VLTVRFFLIAAHGEDHLRGLPPAPLLLPGGLLRGTATKARVYAFTFAASEGSARTLASPQITIQ